MTYAEFLQSKQCKVVSSGFEKPRENMNQYMFGWQKDIFYWALKKGRAAECERAENTEGSLFDLLGEGRSVGLRAGYMVHQYHIK